MEVLFCGGFVLGVVVWCSYLLLLEVLAGGGWWVAGCCGLGLGLCSLYGVFGVCLWYVWWVYCFLVGRTGGFGFGYGFEHEVLGFSVFGVRCAWCFVTGWVRIGCSLVGVCGALGYFCFRLHV